MAMSPAQAATRLRRLVPTKWRPQLGLLEVLNENYTSAFATAFPDEDVPTVAQVGRALASYQRLLASPSRFDRYLNGDESALSATEQAGHRLFRRNCATCHDSPGIGGQKLRKLGRVISWPDDQRADSGREQVTGKRRDHMVFAVPSLRNVAQTGPWFHDGSVTRLEDAVRLMGLHQVGRTFSDEQVDAIVAFLNTFNAETVAPWAEAPTQPSLSTPMGER